MNILMCSDRSIVYLSFWLRETAATHQSRVFFVISSEWEEVVKVSNFTEMRTDGIQEDQLELNISFDQIDSWLVVNVDQI